jgi:predicted enzyme related to lactoylglutathione lyase
MTPDTAAAAAFYRSVVGWETRNSGMPGMDYTLVRAQGADIGAMMALDDELRAMGVPPCWTGYVGVDDVDAYVARVTAAGGSVQRAAQDIPEVGRFAVVNDPFGAFFSLVAPIR